MEKNKYLEPKLSEERKMIIKTLILKKYNQVEIGKILNISKQRVNNICSKDKELENIYKIIRTKKTKGRENK